MFRHLIFIKELARKASLFGGPDIVHVIAKHRAEFAFSSARKPDNYATLSVMIVFHPKIDFIYFDIHH